VATPTAASSLGARGAPSVTTRKQALRRPKALGQRGVRHQESQRGRPSLPGNVLEAHALAHSSGHLRDHLLRGNCGRRMPSPPARGGRGSRPTAGGARSRSIPAAEGHGVQQRVENVVFFPDHSIASLPTDAGEGRRSGRRGRRARLASPGRHRHVDRLGVAA
jgi:hypothetical protein